MLQGVASILDPEHTEIVESLWRELEREFGLRAASAAYPHFSYQVVEHYDVGRVKGVLRRFTQKARPFTVRTSGLGLFAGENPTLYVAIARNIRLTQLHTRLWKRLSKTAYGIHEHHYGPDIFIPHITLAAGDFTPEHVPDVIRLLVKRSFNWEIRVDNLALVLDAQGTHDQWIHYPFGGGAA
jgi:2'-5' RNA ligase